MGDSWGKDAQGWQILAILLQASTSFQVCHSAIWSRLPCRLFGLNRKHDILAHFILVNVACVDMWGTLEVRLLKAKRSFKLCSIVCPPHQPATVQFEADCHVVFSVVIENTTFWHIYSSKSSLCGCVGDSRGKVAPGWPILAIFLEASTSLGLYHSAIWSSLQCRLFGLNRKYDILAHLFLVNLACVDMWGTIVLKIPEMVRTSLLFCQWTLLLWWDFFLMMD